MYALRFASTPEIHGQKKTGVGACTEKPFVLIMHIHVHTNGGWALTRRWALTQENTVRVLYVCFLSATATAGSLLHEYSDDIGRRLPCKLHLYLPHGVRASGHEAHACTDPPPSPLGVKVAEAPPTAHGAAADCTERGGWIQE